MGNRFMRTVWAMAVTYALLTAAHAQAPAGQGVPNLSGVWVGTRDGAVFPREAPQMTPSTQETFDYRKNLRGGVRAELDPETLCSPVSPPWLLLNAQGGNSFIEIIQNPKRVLMLFEFDHWVRQVWTDGREHPEPEDLDLSWLGHSTGKWDRDALVVDTIGMHKETWLTPQGHPHTDDLRLTERIRRPDQNTMTIDLTFEDPTMYAKPWGGHLVFNLKHDGELIERLNCEYKWLFQTRDY